MIERIKKTGRLTLRVAALVLIYFIGAATSPVEWDFWAFLTRIAHNPGWTIPVTFALGWVVLFAIAFWLLRMFLKKE